MIFDTLKLSRALQPGFSQVQAETLAVALAASTQDALATKADLATEVAALRVDFTNAISALKLDLARWIVTAIGFNFLATAGLIVTALKVFH